MPDTRCKHYMQLLILLLLLQPFTNTFAQSEAQEHRWGEVILGSFGTMDLSGKTTETLKNGWSGSLMELHLAVIPRIKGLRVGIVFLDGGTNIFRLNPEERVAMQAYEYVTYENGIVTDREEIDEVYCSLSRISASLKWYPIENGFRLLSPNNLIRPYISGGYSLHRISTTMEGGDKAWGLGAYANYGIDVTIPPVTISGFELLENWFVRIEVSTGAIPDWDIRLFPELRPVCAGHYRTIRFGVGIDKI